MKPKLHTVLNKLLGIRPGHRESGMTNREFARNDELFNMACKLAGLPPTARQASKYRSGFGRAYAMRAAATLELQKSLVPHE